MSKRRKSIPVTRVEAFTARAYVCVRVSDAEYDELVTLPTDFSLPDESALFAREWFPVEDMSRVGEAVARYAACDELGMEDFVGGLLFTGDGRPWEHDPSERDMYPTTGYLDRMNPWCHAAEAASRRESYHVSIGWRPLHVDVSGERVVLRHGTRTSQGWTTAQALGALADRGAWDMSVSRAGFVGQVSSQFVAYVRFVRAVCAGLTAEHAEEARRYMLGGSERFEPLAANLSNLHDPWAP